MGRELRRRRCIQRVRHPLRPSRRAGHLLLRPWHALDHQRRAGPDHHSARQLPVRARLPRRLGPGLHAILAAGLGGRWHLHVHHNPAAGGCVRGKGRTRVVMGRELWRWRGARRCQHRLHRAGGRHGRDLHLRSGKKPGRRRTSPSSSRTGSNRISSRGTCRATVPGGRSGCIGRQRVAWRSTRRP